MYKLTQQTMSTQIPNNRSDWPSDYFSNDLRRMALTITELELWDWFKNESPPEGQGYTWWSDEPRQTSAVEEQDEHSKWYTL